jgi:hypothetical protein
MDDKDELVERLRAKVDELEAQLAHDNTTRQQLLAASDKLLPALAAQRELWDQQHAAHLEAMRRAPELERLREEGLMPKMAILMTRQTTVEERQTALETQFLELWSLGVETYTRTGELVDLLKQLLQRGAE